MHAIRVTKKTWPIYFCKKQTKENADFGSALRNLKTGSFGSCTRKWYL